MSKIEIHGICVSICFIFVNVVINASYAQSADNSSNTQPLPNFLTYSNNDIGFTIQYPSNWKVEEYDTSTSFTVPDREFGVAFGLRLKKLNPI